jgi:2-C-methyl-D-erythritol 4-phosphate cytidylyltransferase
LGHEVAICKGDSVNLKITTPGDLYVAEQMLRNRR